MQQQHFSQTPAAAANGMQLRQPRAQEQDVQKRDKTYVSQSERGLADALVANEHHCTMTSNNKRKLGSAAQQSKFGTLCFGGNVSELSVTAGRTAHSATRQNCRTAA